MKHSLRRTYALICIVIFIWGGAPARLTALTEYDAPNPNLSYYSSTLYEEELATGGAGTYQEFEYTVSYDNTYVRIDRYAGTDETVIIPDTIDGLPVTELSYNAFADCRQLKSVTIPDNITEVGGYLFRNCSSLVSVSFGNGINVISSGMFVNCTSLLEIELPDSVQRIETNAFYNCISLSNVKLGGGVTAISDYAFSSCRNLKSITINEGNTSFSVEDGVLFSHDKTTLYLYPSAKEGAVYTIPETVQSVKDDAFYDTPLVGVNIPETVVSIGSGNFGSIKLYGKKGCYAEQYVKENYGSFTAVGDNETNFDYAEQGDGTLTIISYTGTALSIEVPDIIDGKAVTAISKDAFRGFCNFVSLTLPDTLVKIGDSAFYDCEAISSVDLGSSVQFLGLNCFSDCDSVETIVIPNSVIEMKSAFSSCRVLKTVALGSRVENINSAFSYCTNLTKIVLPGSIRNMNFAFDECTKLTNVTISEGIEDFYGSFHNCTSLQSISIPKSVRYIGWSSFENCTNLTSAIVYNPSAEISDDAFANCPRLKLYGKAGSTTQAYAAKFNLRFEAIDISDTNTFEYTVNPDNTVTITAYLGSQVNVTIPKTIDGKPVTKIASRAFYNKPIFSVTSQANITHIGEYAFYGCVYLINVSLKDTLRFVGVGAFDGTALYNNTPNGLIYVGKVAVRYNGAMPSNTNLVLRSNTLAIADGAFSWCKGLEQISIGNGVTAIGEGAFSHCSNLQAVHMPASVLTIGIGAFGSCTSLTEASIPNTSTAIAPNAFEHCDALTLYGYSGSTAQQHAQEQGIPFQAISTVSAISLSKAAATLGVGFYEILTVTFTPTEATNRVIEWKSSNPSVAEVDASGKVIAVGEGTAMITATSMDGAKAARCTVTVSNSQFIALLSDHISEKRLITLIEQFDLNNNGRIDLTDLIKVKYRLMGLA